MAYNIDSITDDCYPGTTCLINKMGIRDEAVLAETEAAVVLGKASLLDQHPIQGDFDFNHYKRIHHFLFSDLYDWAGQIRTINLSKKGTEFVPADEIIPCAAACFARLNSFHPDGLSQHQFAEEIAQYMGLLLLLYLIIAAHRVYTHNNWMAGTLKSVALYLIYMVILFAVFIGTLLWVAVSIFGVDMSEYF